MWTLTYSVDGRRHVEYLPSELVPQVAQYAERGAAYQVAVGEILGINAQLLTLWREQQRNGREGSTGRRSST